MGPRFYATIEAGRCAALSDETNAKVDELFPGFGWVYGPGANRKGHSFTLTGEGNIHRQLLALEWLSSAPVVDGWTFYAARQSGPIRGHAIKIDDLHFDPKEIWVTPTVDQEHERIDLVVWHPAWNRIESKQRSTVTFLFLDEALGEYGTDWWVGKIDFGNQKLAGAFPLEELADYMVATAGKHGWKKCPPGELWTLFHLEESAGEFPRGDTMTYTTCVPKLFREFMDVSGRLDDPLKGLGADYVYVSIEAGFFPKGAEVNARSEIEEVVASALGSIRGGRHIGGGLGRERGYCDFLIFDGSRSLAAISSTLRKKNAPPGTMIEFFAREKRSQRIAL